MSRGGRPFMSTHRRRHGDARLDPDGGFYFTETATQRLRKDEAVSRRVRTAWGIEMRRVCPAVVDDLYVHVDLVTGVIYLPDGRSAGGGLRLEPHR